MPRHYSKVVIELPDSPSDPQEIVLTIDCDVCGEQELRTHVAHFGTLVRVLSDAFDDMGRDDGETYHVVDASWQPSSQKQKVLDYLNRVFPEWKAGRLRARQ